MLKQTHKKYLTRLIVLFVACVFAFALSTSALTAQAAVRNTIVFEEDFRSLELSGKKWTEVYENEESSKITHYTGGNGSLVIDFARTGNMSNTVYLDKYVEVADTEDLVVEYSVKNFTETENIGGLITNLMLCKGLGSATEKPSANVREDVDAKLEGIASFRDGQMNRYFTAIGYSLRSGVSSLNDSSTQISVANTERSQAVKDYYNSLYTPVYIDGEFVGNNVPYGYDNVSTDPDSNLPQAKVRSWCGEKFGDYLWGSDDVNKVLYSQDELDDYSIYHIFQSGYTFKHVYKATGGYECYVKANGASDSSYVIFASLSDTFGFEQNDEKRFSNRSGYVGINMYGEEVSLEFDQFTVYTQEGQEKNIVADEDFGLVNGERYGSGENTSMFASVGEAKAIQMDSDYDEVGYIFDNPDTTNYIYGSSRNKIIYDERFEDYAIVNIDFSIKEITPDKNFGFIIGGTDIDHLLERDRNIFIYLTSREGSDNYFIGVDYIFNGYRNSIGSIMDTGIPVENSGDHSYKLSICAKQNKSLVVSIFDENGNKTVEDITFAQEGIELILRNRFAVYNGNSEVIPAQENSSAVVVLQNLEIHNTYFYSFSSATLKGISETFDTPSVGNEFTLSNGVSVYVAEMNSRIPNANVFVKDGVLNMIGSGHQSGVVSQYAYNSFELTFDIVDMQRKIEGSTPVCSAPIVIQFGGMVEGINTGTEKSIVIRNPLMIETEDGIKRVNGHDDMAIGLAVPDTDRVSNLAFGHDGIAEDFGVLRHNLLDPELDGKVIRCKLTYSEDSVLAFSYCVLGLEDEALLDQPVYSKEYMGGEGYIALTSTHSSVSALSAIMKIDNFTIVSTDTYSTPSEDDNDDDVGGDFVWDVIWPDDIVNQPEKEGCFSQINASYYLLALLFVVPCIKVIDSKQLLKKKENKR